MRPGRTGEPVCGPCADRAWQAKRREEWLAGSGPWAVEVCVNSGMSPREARSDLARIPVQIKRALPEESVKSLLAGADPKAGFGLGGNGTGAGKTSAVAAILKAYIRAREEARVHAGGHVPNDYLNYTSPLAWTCWPSAVAVLRTRATVEGYVERTIDRLINAQVLFLDDLGSERIKGSYVEDFAASQLDVVVDERYRDERPTFYTTNLDFNGMVAFYGARMVSRLCGDNPLYVVEGLPDLRIGGAR